MPKLILSTIGTEHCACVLEGTPECQTLFITTPMRRMSGLVADSEERLRKIEKDGYDLLYTAEIQNYMDRKITNLGRAYALILSTYCNGMMQHHTKEHPDF